MACPEKDGNEVCGKPQFSNGSSLCEEHFAYKWPVTHERLKAEVKCPACIGAACTYCGGRGMVDTRRKKSVHIQPAVGAEPIQNIAKRVFDPGVM